MAPITRSSQHGRSLLREGSWQIPDDDLPPTDSQEAMNENINAEDMDENMSGSESTEEDSNESLLGETGGYPNLPNSNAQNMLQPLQQTADRVTQEVEDFARRLDRFQSSREVRRDKLWADALDLIGEFRNIAKSRKSQASSALQQSRRASRSRQENQSSVQESQAEIRKVREETELWDLLGIVTSSQNPSVQADFAKKQKTCLGSLHRYSTDLEIWEAFLSADPMGSEYEDILSLLQDSASSSRPNIEALTKPLTDRAERGDGIWKGGWLYTRENIKTQKRNRGLFKPMERRNQSDRSRDSDAQRTVEQLDPDARFREDAVLMAADEFHEQAAWIACWELLRRGAEPVTQRDWWASRSETWRALGIKGGISDSPEQETEKQTRFMGLWKANNDWSESCYKISHMDKMVSRHEAAVYALLAGDSRVPMQVCETIDDFLFVFMNALLIERFRAFGVAISAKNTRQNFHPEPAKDSSVQQLIKHIQQHDKTKQESQRPVKIIQCMIVAKDFDALFLKQGRALAQMAKQTGDLESLLLSDGQEPMDETAMSTATDADALRIVAHQQLVLKALGCLDEVYARHEEILENNIAAYIDWLHQEGKISLIPLYASTLSAERGARVLGAVITDIIEFRERETTVSLMKRYKLNVARILWRQYLHKTAVYGLAANENLKAIKPVRLTEYGTSGSIISKAIKIRSNFFGDRESLEVSEDVLIRCIEWYSYGEKRCWGQACRAASSLYKFFLCRGRLVAARALGERAGLSTISLLALKVNLKDLGSTVHTPEEDDSDADGMVDEEYALPMSPSRRRQFFRRQSSSLDSEQRKTGQQHLWDQARTWRQLEELVEALDSLEKWQEVADEVEKTKGDLSHMRAMKKIVQAALDDVDTTMAPLLEPDFLSQPADEAESITLTNIRNHYLPECVLAYNSVLNFAGHVITRKKLVECMNLAQTVATNDTLTDAFTASSRMKELVTAFAVSSQALLHANESGPVRKGKKEAGIEIWQVKAADAGLAQDS